MTSATRSLTIAHVTGEMSFAGGEVQVFLLCQGLAKRGHRNVLLCPEASASARESTRRGIEMRPIWIRGEWSPRNALGVRRQLRDVAPDVVFLHTGRANWLGGLACRSLGLPAISTRRMDRPVKKNWRTRFVYGVVASRAVAISRAVEARLVEGGVAPGMIRVIHSAVEPEALVPGRSPAAVRAEACAPPGAFCGLAVASLVRRKGLDVLIESLARLRGGEQIWIAGEGPQRAELEQLALRRGVAGRVRFLGQRSDVADWMAACDVLIAPSRQEGLGVAVLEAMAAGRAVIASRVGGIPEAVSDGQTGLLVAPDDPDALAAAITRLRNDPAWREQLGRASRARVEDCFQADRMIDAYERLCFEVVAEAAPT